MSADQPYRVLVLRRDTGGDGGDSIYENRLYAALSERAQVDTISFSRRGRLARLKACLLEGALPDQTGFGLDAERARAAGALASGAYDVAIVGHEYLDHAALQLRSAAQKGRTPLLSMRHNMTSSLVGSVLGGGAGRAAESLWRAQERAALNGDLFAAVSVISRADQAKVLGLAPRQRVTLVLPGAPASTPMAADAPLRGELVVGGSFDWWPKKRDLQRFVDDMNAMPEKPGPIYAERSVPTAQRQALGALDADALDYGAAIRFGVITDRFQAGHKLKTSAYLQANCIVLTFADVEADFGFFPEASEFIVRLSGVADLRPAMARLAERPVEAVRAGLERFKAALNQNMAWRDQGATFAGLVESLAAARRAGLS